LPREAAETTGLAYAILLHGISSIWYLTVGGIAMFTSHVKLHDLWARPAADPVLGAEETA
jgi:hypothetical protein